MTYAKYPGGVQLPEPIRPADMISPEAINKSTGGPLDLGYRSYRKSGKVDFPNGFGVSVRHTYQCVFTSDRSSHLVD